MAQATDIDLIAPGGALEILVAVAPHERDGWRQARPALRAEDETGEETVAGIDSRPLFLQSAVAGGHEVADAVEGVLVDDGLMGPFVDLAPEGDLPDIKNAAEDIPNVLQAPGLPTEEETAIVQAEGDLPDREAVQIETIDLANLEGFGLVHDQAAVLVRIPSRTLLANVSEP